MLSGTSLPVNTLVKIKEGLLRQRELEIDRWVNNTTFWWMDGWMDYQGVYIILLGLPSY